MSRFRRSAGRWSIAPLVGVAVGALLWPQSCVTFVQGRNGDAGGGGIAPTTSATGTGDRPPRVAEPLDVDGARSTVCEGTIPWPTYSSSAASSIARLKGEVTSVAAGVVAVTLLLGGSTAADIRRRRRRQRASDSAAS